MLNLHKNKYTTFVRPVKFWLHAIHTLNLLCPVTIGVRSERVPYNPM